MTMLRPLLAVVALIALGACGGSDEPKAAIPTGLSVDERSIVEDGLEAKDDLPDDLRDAVVTMFVRSDFAAVCDGLNIVVDAATIEDAASRSDAWVLGDALFGEVLRHEVRSDVEAECPGRLADAATAREAVYTP